MSKITTFQIWNSSELELDVVHEPEAVEFALPKNEELTVAVNSGEDTVTLSVSIDKKSGKIRIGVWSEKSSYDIIYKDKNVFDEYLK
jgi:hypothetical protein